MINPEQLVILNPEVLRAVVGIGLAYWISWVLARLPLERLGELDDPR